MIIERPFAVFIGIIVLIPLIIISIIKKKPIGRIILLILLDLYISMVIAVTIFPVIIDPETMIFDRSIINIRPFSTISDLLFNNSDQRTVILQIAGNIVMCIPYGVALPFLFSHKNKILYVVDALLFPLAIELSQLIICIVSNSFYRTIDIDDIILNFSGILIGLLIYRLLPKYTKEYFGKRKKTNKRTENKQTC